MLLVSVFQFFSAALVTIDEAKQTLNLKTNLVFYGKDANKNNSLACAEEIAREWAPLAANQFVDLGARNAVKEGKYKIALSVSYELVSEKKAQLGIDNRKNFENNYIEIPRDPIKICAHEYGHLLGLGEMNAESVQLGPKLGQLVKIALIPR